MSQTPDGQFTEGFSHTLRSWLVCRVSEPLHHCFGANHLVLERRAGQLTRPIDGAIRRLAENLALQTLRLLLAPAVMIPCRPSINAGASEREPRPQFP
jgi:hypothetical protein